MFLIHLFINGAEYCICGQDATDLYIPRDIPSLLQSLQFTLAQIALFEPYVDPMFSYRRTQQSLMMGSPEDLSSLKIAGE